MIIWRLQVQSLVVFKFCALNQSTESVRTSFSPSLCKSKLSEFLLGLFAESMWSLRSSAGSANYCIFIWHTQRLPPPKLGIKKVCLQLFACPAPSYQQCQTRWCTSKHIMVTSFSIWPDLLEPLCAIFESSDGECSPCARGVVRLTALTHSSLIALKTSWLSHAHLVLSPMLTWRMTGSSRMMTLSSYIFLQGP